MSDAAPISVDPLPPGAGIGLVAQVGYGVGQIAGQVFRDLPSLLLLFFMTTVLGIGPAIAGAAIFVPKLVWGVCCDVAVGVFSDRWQRRIARRWWLLAGAVGAPVAMVLLFHVPEASTSVRVAYIAAVYSLYMLVFAIFSVPYLTLASQLSSDTHQRTVLMAWRLVFTAAGVMTSGALAPAIIQARGGGQPAYEAMSIVLAIISPLALLVAFFGAGHAATRSSYTASTVERVRLRPREAIAVLARPRFSVLLFAALLQLTGSGMGYASLLYFLTYNMGRSDAFALIGVIAFVACAGIVLAQPMWVALAKRYGKKPIFVIATLAYAAIYAIWSFAADWGSWGAYTLAFLGAIGNSGWAMLGFSMLSDVASEDESNAGLYSAAWIAVDKIGFALGGTLLTGLVLSAFGFDSARAVAGLPQSQEALLGVMLTFGLLPAAFNIAAALIFARWGRN